MEDCVFCKIVKGELPAHKVWEDDRYLAFLSIFPNTDGFTVLIPKKRYPSNFAICPPEVVKDLASRAQIISQQICRAFPGCVERCAFVFEGFGVDHLHVKLIPLHKTVGRPISPEFGKVPGVFFKKYEGYISTQEPTEPADEEHLAKIAAKIKAAADKQ